MHKRAVGAVVLLGLVIVATVALLLVRRDPSPPPPVVPEAPDTRTLLVQLRDPALLARASVLVGVEQERLDQLWWTTQWWVDQIGSEEVSAAELGRKPVPYVMETVQDQIDVKIDDAWVLDRLAFAGLVDAVGGVRIDVAEPTIYLTDRGDEAVLQAGVQTVSGAQAADYVLDAALRDETTRLRRFQAVWDQVLRRFPTDSEKARALVVSLGALSKATMPNEALSTLLSDAHALRIAGDYAQATVALDDQNRIRVRPPQGVRAALAADPLKTGSRIEELLGGFPRPDAPVARIQAVTPRSDSVQTIREQLLTRSWRSAWGGRTRTPVTVVVADPDVPDADVVGLEQALGLTPARGQLPLGQAKVSVSASHALDVGL